MSINHTKRLFRTAFAAGFLVLALAFISTRTSAQSRNFKLTQSLEIQYNILRTLATEYVDTVNFSKLVNFGIDAMLESIDPYTEFVPEENEETIEMMTTASYGGIGATIRKDSLGVMIMQAYENSPAIRYNLEPGDIIMKIDDQDISKLSVDECSKRMRGNPGTQVKFTIKKGRTGNVVERVVTRDKVHTSDVPYWGFLEFPEESKLMKDSNVVFDNSPGEEEAALGYHSKYAIGYIKVSSFTLNGSEDVRKALIQLKEWGANRIVLDLRGNGGGLMDEATDIVSLFVPKGTLVATAKGRGPGANFECVTDKDPVDTLIPLMVLTSSSSASSSEIVAGALQDLDRAVIMGTRTYGKGLVQSFRPVGYNGKLKLTIAKYYTPSGRCIQILDYAHRNSDGSVGAVPDSLKKAFKTKGGRTVYDGGGITPDVEIKGQYYSRPVLALSLSGIMEEYAVEFYKKNIEPESFLSMSSTMPQLGENKDGLDDFELLNVWTRKNLDTENAGSFRMTDAQWEDFVKFASQKKFDHRSSAEVVFDQMIREAKAEGLYEKDKEAYALLASKVKLSKEEVLNLYRDEIQPLMEEEIIHKYAFTAPRIRHMLDYDVQLWRAVAAWK
ncbi:MAG: S41 family peptidase [Bacteroidales bacterium]|nr:S41 family peptidase [Bacteroidales bacterium]